MRDQTITEVQGLITCSTSTYTVRIWTTDTGKFIQTATPDGVDDNLLKACSTLDVYSETYVVCHMAFLGSMGTFKVPHIPFSKSSPTPFAIRVAV